MYKIVLGLLFSLSSIYTATKKDLRTYAKHFSANNGYNCIDSTCNGEALFLEKYLNKDTSIIFDVGANVGAWSDLVIEYFPNAQIYAFEPTPEAFRKLKIKQDKNELKAFNLAIGECDALMDFWCWGNQNFGFHELNGLYYRPNLKDFLHTQPSKISVTVTSLDKFCRIHNIQKIDFLKIDTEGNEWGVLLGAKQLISDGKIDTIQFEYGGCYLDSCTKLEDVYKFLKSEGFHIYRLGALRPIEVDAWKPSLENFQYSNYVASKQKLQFEKYN